MVQPTLVPQDDPTGLELCEEERVKLQREEEHDGKDESIFHNLFHDIPQQDQKDDEEVDELLGLSHRSG